MGIRERRAREREARRHTILKATRELVQEHGFGGTTTRQIAERCELSEATLFFYFSSKDEILISLLGEACDFWADGLGSILEMSDPPDAKLSEVWRFFGEVQRHHPEYVHVSTYLAYPHSTDAVDDDVMTDLVKRTGSNFRLLVDLMEQLGGVEHPRVAADLLWSAFLGLMVLRQGRVNLSAPQHPNDGDLDRAYGLLSRAFTGERA